MRRNFILIAALSLFVQPTLAWAKLKVGNRAPRLSIATWVKGKPVSLKKAGKDEVFVIEFWATWCGPCKAGIPRLSEMQDRFRNKGVTFVGVTAEKVGVVKKFLKSGWDKKMRYTVAVDNRGQTNADWMRAAGQNGIPCAFVVKGGKIKWIGHPASGLDAMVAKLTKDTKHDKYAKNTKECDVSKLLKPEDHDLQSVAVVDFYVDEKLGASVGRGLADICRGLVQESGAYLLLDRENMLSILGEEDFASVIKCDKTRCLVDFGKKLLAQKMVYGRVSKVGETLVLTIKMTDVGSAKIEAFKTVSVKGGLDDLLDHIRPQTCELLRDDLEGNQQPGAVAR